MVFITSISPRHVLEDRQQQATSTWLTHGQVYSLNHPDEITVLKKQGYDERIVFVPTYRTQENLFRKKYVCLNALTDFIKQENFDRACIINSDICITEDKSVIEMIKGEMMDSFVYLHRWNFN
ncbi:MAG: hypothetical protein ACRCST_13055, partial [Turicibacter sp.]